MEPEAERVIDKYGLNTIILSDQVPADRSYLIYFSRSSLWFRKSGPAYIAGVRP
jgi:hypothetical protein